MRSAGAPSRERGAALFVVMIMMVVMAWFGISALRLSGQNQQIVVNSQARHHATAAAQRAIEQTISSNLFTVDPVAVAATPITSDVGQICRAASAIEPPMSPSPTMPILSNTGV